MDLTAFRANRSLRRVEPPFERVLPCRWGNDEFGVFVTELIALVESGAESLDIEAHAAARVYLSETEPPENRPVQPSDYDPPSAPKVFGPGEADAGGDRLIWVLSALDRFLTAHDNSPDPGDLETEIHDLYVRIGHDPDAMAQYLPAGYGNAWRRLTDTLAAALLDVMEGERAGRVNRLLLIFGLLRYRGEQMHPFRDPVDIHRLLQLRSVVLPAPPFPHVLPQQRVRLVRQATVADLWVVRSEWRCYTPGEIADIRNVMAREKLEHTSVRLEERELTQSDVEQTTTTDEASRETAEQSEMSEAVNRELTLSVGLDAQVDTSGQYGPTKVDTTVSGSADFSISEARQRATSLARSVVGRAASRVESLVRRERIERLLTRTEDTDKHGFVGAATHVRGIYRWVDRVDRLQVYRYPHRLQFEFQFPEPGRYMAHQLQKPSAQGVLKDPGTLELDGGITRDNWRTLAVKYGATGLPSPPDERLAVAAALTVGPPNPMPADDTNWNPPSSAASTDVVIPPGYKATHVNANVTATPLLAKWKSERTQHSGMNDLEGFHGMVASVAVGEHRWDSTKFGSDGKNSVQLGPQSDRETQYADAVLYDNHSGDLDAPLMGRATIALTATGANTAIAAFEFDCVLTDEAYGEWQQDVFEGLIAAHGARVREYREEQQQLGTDRVRLHERSPARNAELIRDELKRQVISWLLSAGSFQGVDGVGADVRDFDIGKVLSSATMIQYLEQAFEWNNMTFVCYPYYWARRSQWDQLQLLDTVDPDLGRFLRAGSVRVVVPARPGFEAAATHWLHFQQPWAGGAAPVPGQPFFVSVAEEIRDLTQPPVDGEPGESWEVRLPTTLRWLDTSDELPHNPLARLGAAPWTPNPALCEDGDSPA